MKKMGYLYAVFSAAIFGAMPLLTKILYARGYDSISCAFYRMFLPLLLIFIYLKTKKITVMPTKKNFPRLLNLSFFFMLTSLTLFSSYNYIKSATATSIHFTYPILIFVLVAIITKKFPKKGEIISIMLAAVGLFMIGDLSDLSSAYGIFLSFLSAITYSIYSIYMQKFAAQKQNPVKTLFWLNLMGASYLLLFSLIKKTPIKVFAMGDLAILLFYAFLITIGASFLYQIAVVKIGAKHTSIMSTAEPVVSIFIGFFLLSETLKPIQIIAAILILISTILIVKFDG